MFFEAHIARVGSISVANPLLYRLFKYGDALVCILLSATSMIRRRMSRFMLLQCIGARRVDVFLLDRNLWRCWRRLFEIIVAVVLQKLHRLGSKVRLTERLAHLAHCRHESTVLSTEGTRCVGEKLLSLGKVRYAVWIFRLSILNIIWVITYLLSLLLDLVNQWFTKKSLLLLLGSTCWHKRLRWQEGRLSTGRSEQAHLQPVGTAYWGGASNWRWKSATLDHKQTFLEISNTW